MVVASAIIGDAEAPQTTCIPAVVYSDPEILTVGEHRDSSLKRHVVVPWASSGRALTLGSSEGRLELVYDATDSTVVGLHAVGAGVSELAGEASLAIEMRASVEDLALSIHPHPTLNEVIQDAAKIAARDRRHVSPTEISA